MKVIFFCSFVNISKVGFLGHIVVLFLVFSGTIVLFSVMMEPLYLPISHVFVVIVVVCCYHYCTETKSNCIFRLARNLQSFSISLLRAEITGLSTVPPVFFGLHFPNDKRRWKTVPKQGDSLSIFRSTACFINWDILSF